MGKLIKQRSADDCGVAVLAMFLGCTYEAALALCKTSGGGEWSPETGLCYELLLDALRIAGQPSALVREFNAERPAIVVVNSINIEGGLHGVYWDGRLVFDPSLGATLDGASMWDRAVLFAQRLADLAALIMQA
jgi:hypothetical protein